MCKFTYFHCSTKSCKHIFISFSELSVDIGSSFSGMALNAFWKRVLHICSSSPSARESTLPQWWLPQWLPSEFPWSIDEAVKLASTLYFLHHNQRSLHKWPTPCTAGCHVASPQGADWQCAVDGSTRGLALPHPSPAALCHESTQPEGVHAPQEPCGS